MSKDSYPGIDKALYPGRTVQAGSAEELCMVAGLWAPEMKSKRGDFVVTSVDRETNTLTTSSLPDGLQVGDWVVIPLA